MSSDFCANCGSETQGRSVCGACGLDPEVLRESMIRHLKSLEGSTQPSTLSLDLRYPGELTTLFFSASIMMLTTLALGLATLGLFLLGIAVALFQMRAAEAAERQELRRISESSEPLLWNLALLAAFRLDIDPPPVYIRYSTSINAYTSGLWGSHYVVLNSELIRLYSPAELLFVLGHEFGHAKLDHVTWMMLTRGDNLRIPVVREVLGFFFRSWTKVAERSADRAGLLATRDAASAARALIKLVHGDRPLSIEDFLAAAENEANPATTRLSESVRSHPLLKTRIRALQQFAVACQMRGLFQVSPTL